MAVAGSKHWTQPQISEQQIGVVRECLVTSSSLQPPVAYVAYKTKAAPVRSRFVDRIVFALLAADLRIGIAGHRLLIGRTEILVRIHRHIVYAHLVVQMRTSCAA